MRSFAAKISSYFADALLEKGRGPVARFPPLVYLLSVKRGEQQPLLRFHSFQSL
jgi:hypothetical protein